MPYSIDSVPAGYHLHAYDDCGIADRQPHVLMDDSYMWTFNTSDTDADLKQRSAVFSYKQVNMVYDGLDPKLSYVLALTYASDHVYKRVQSLWADGIELHGPVALPNAKAIRVIVKVPELVTADGKMKLELRIHGEVNATVSIAELWANAPGSAALKLSSVSSLSTRVTGRVLDLAYDGAGGVNVDLRRPAEDKPLASTVTAPDGSFSFPSTAYSDKQPRTDLLVVAGSGGNQVSKTIPASEQGFEPVRYRPIPVETAGLRANTISLDGKWRIDPDPKDQARGSALDSPGFKDIHVPGQWLQQGFDIPQDATAAMAREFVIPKQWADYRIFLRFDSIHAGTHYWLNGKPLGYSENLFTPVEWEITDSAKPGETNRLDLAMKVDTVSEKLSISSGYAFHSLGGIDRSVKIYALPKTFVKDLHVSTDLDTSYKDAFLQIRLGVESEGKGLSARVSLFDSEDNAVAHTKPEVALKPGQGSIDVSTRVTNPTKWNAEKPYLYRLVIDLMQDGKRLERIERNIGFRKIEIRDRQLYVNGARVKLAGACRHEIDPLTGRADTARWAETDVKLIKGANLNYIRTSHYPPNQELLDAADRLGVYLEVEAPFCWVAPTDEIANAKEVLTPTSAMIDYCHTHPSVTLWSIANESHFNPVFAESNRMVKELDPTRPTTFNHPFSREAEENCDIANRHYPGMPYDAVLPNDPRPLILGEYFFPVCHEQTDVMINPGLRELYGHGQADPDSEWAKYCAKSYETATTLLPGAKPGFWTHIYNSNQLVGGAIWAAFDEPFYLANGKHCGYAWVHGFWGLIDGWRRPKTEWYMSRCIFSPVWFPKREVEFTVGQESVRVPVENRYSFTNLKELKFTWEMGKKHGKIKTNLAPGGKGYIDIPIPLGTGEGSRVILRVADAAGTLVNELAIQLSQAKPAVLPQLKGPAPNVSEDGAKITVEGERFSLVLDKSTGDLATADPKHRAPVIRFPSVHVTRYDFGDLAGPNSPPYSVLPDEKTRVVESVTVEKQAKAVQMTVKDRYERFAGSITWTINARGMGKISYDYLYSGEDMNAREVGARFVLSSECDEIKWRRWSEWGVFPEDAVCRTEGDARARRDKSLGDGPESMRPKWPWKFDQTEMGTNDFRSVKFSIYQADLLAADTSGLRVYANADAHVRPALLPDGVRFHILTECKMGPVKLKAGDHVKGEFVVEMVR